MPGIQVKTYNFDLGLGGIGDPAPAPSPWAVPLRDGPQIQQVSLQQDLGLQGSFAPPPWSTPGSVGNEVSDIQLDFDLGLNFIIGAGIGFFEDERWRLGFEVLPDANVEADHWVVASELGEVLLTEPGVALEIV